MTQFNTFILFCHNCIVFLNTGQKNAFFIQKWPHYLVFMMSYQSYPYQPIFTLVCQDVSYVRAQLQLQYTIKNGR